MPKHSSPEEPQAPSAIESCRIGPFVDLWASGPLKTAGPQSKDCETVEGQPARGKDVLRSMFCEEWPPNLNVNAALSYGPMVLQILVRPLCGCRALPRLERPSRDSLVMHRRPQLLLPLVGVCVLEVV